MNNLLILDTDAASVLAKAELFNIFFMIVSKAVISTPLSLATLAAILSIVKKTPSLFLATAIDSNSPLPITI